MKIWRAKTSPGRAKFLPGLANMVPPVRRLVCLSACLSGMPASCLGDSPHLHAAFNVTRIHVAQWCIMQVCGRNDTLLSGRLRRGSVDGRQEWVSEGAALGMYAPCVCATHPQRNDTIHATLALSKSHCQVGGASWKELGGPVRCNTL